MKQLFFINLSCITILYGIAYAIGWDTAEKLVSNGIIYMAAVTAGNYQYKNHIKNKQ
jgi:hypothetical protein